MLEMEIKRLGEKNNIIKINQTNFPTETAKDRFYEPLKSTWGVGFWVRFDPLS